MLDDKTKKQINDCRDVLVGKVPDPKSQIEQITLALIYKFMDDMDRESVEEFGGKPKFFADEFEKYSWRNLLSPTLSGIDIQVLYSEALDKLPTNPNIPEFFRNIFKNAFLPYKDPSTLRMFLKHIDVFEYSHSEKLGDAFEYLLSVMGSQGDAGQFRTPRHIIDFITACLNPKKGESVADPACGTAGFLLSAYKHILNQNTDKRIGDKLTPDDRRKIAENFVGYDISPDMVRLSLVNMYLHGFSTPKIFEYDTLSSEDRWDETFDLVLANPPFMTPKGGIRPHKKFGVQANKAEVLFTDYIAEHLNKNGRAGIVVPNGIVATTQTAYKQLRKLLVDNSLIAVISLPAGCFNPYSGVKTSVLMLDKGLVKKSEHVLFIKIANDGFDLGAQRREHDKNDLPLALEAFNSYKQSINSDKSFDEEKYSSICTLVEKEKILVNKDIVLNAERYLEVSNNIIGEFPITNLGDITEIITKGTTPTSVGFSFVSEGINFIKIESIMPNGTVLPNKFAYINEDCHKSLKRSALKENDVLFSIAGALGRTTIVEKKYLPANTNQALAIIRLKKGVTPLYIASILRTDIIKSKLDELKVGVAQSNISLEQLRNLEIPLPPLEIQEQIVKEIEGYQKIIDGAKMVVENYKPTISIKPEWEMLDLGSFAKLIGGSTPSKENEYYWKNGNIDWITCSDFSNNPMYIDDSINKITEKAVKESSTHIIPKDTLVLVTRVSLGKMAFVRKPTALNQDLTAIIVDEEKVDKKYIYFFLLSIADKIKENGHGATVKGVTREYVKDIKVPLPSLDEQTELTKRIESEQQLISANKQLISIFEQKIKDKINEVWGLN